MSADRRTSTVISAARFPPNRDTFCQSRNDGKLYEMVARTLEQEIVNGLHPVGSLLPTEDELRKRFSVSRHTIREALRKLRSERLVTSRQGAGTIVASPRHSDDFVLNAENINDLVSYSSNIWLDLETTGIEAVTDAQAARIGVRDGEKWLVVRGYVTSTDSELPICWAEHFINIEYQAVAEMLPRHRGPVFRLIEDAMGVEIVEIEQEISGELVPAELARGLGVEPSSAAIEVKRVYTTAERKIAQITLHTHPASRFRYMTSMRRPRG